MTVEKEILFSGRIASFISHELRNTLAVIKENAGLMNDLLMMSGGIKNWGKYTDIIKIIQNQIDTGEETTSLLNRFSHLNDAEKDIFDSHSSVTETLRLIKRALKQKELKIYQNDFRGNIIETSHFYFQMVMYFILDAIIQNAEYGDLLEIDGKKNEKISIIFKCLSIEKLNFSDLNDSLAPYLSIIKAVLTKEKNLISVNFH